MKLFLLILVFFMGEMASAQEPPLTTQQQLEGLAGATENETQEDDQYLQQPDYLKKHPLNINTATAEEWQLLPFLNDLQIGHLIRYRNFAGKFISLYELQAVPALDLATIRKMLPFVIAGPAMTTRENFASRFKGEQFFVLRVSRVLEKSKGYDPSISNPYLGDRNHLMFRYRYQYKDLLYFGLVADKDAGEQFFEGVQGKGFDFYSFHFFIKKLGAIRALALGDYTINLGQGLIHWQSLGFGKSSEVMMIKRQSAVVMPYRSGGEFYFNRGAALTLQKNKMEASFFASCKKISGNVSADSAGQFTSLLASGLYRNATEIAGRNKISQTSAGANLSYRSTVFKAGINTVAHFFDRSFRKKDEPYNRFVFQGRNIYNASADYSYTYKNFHFFGEAAFDRNGYAAFVNGALISLDSKIDLSLLYRDIPKEYQSLYGNAFTESSSPNNEKGFFAGVSIKPSPSWHVNAYADYYRFPWLKYRVNAPTSGSDYSLQWNYHPNKQTEFYVRYRNGNKAINSSPDAVVNYPSGKTKQNLRLHFSMQLSAALSVRSRIEMVWYEKKGDHPEEGFLAYMESHCKFFQKLNSSFRLQFFETAGYNSRIYAYESDVLYSFSIPAFFDKGFRGYFNLNYDIGKYFSCWLRYASSIYKNVKEIGSGLDAIRGNARSEVKVQIQYSF